MSRPVKIHGYELGTLGETILNSDESVVVRIVGKFPLKSVEIALLIEAGIGHQRKFGDKLKVVKLPDSDIKIFNILKIGDIINYE